MTQSLLPFSEDELEMMIRNMFTENDLRQIREELERDDEEDNDAGTE